MCVDEQNTVFRSQIGYVVFATERDRVTHTYLYVTNTLTIALIFEKYENPFEGAILYVLCRFGNRNNEKKMVYLLSGMRASEQE